MNEYTLGLALEDFIPVIFSSIGLYLIGRMVSQINGRLGHMALAGWLFVTLGGLLKAVWKLIMAVTATRVNLIWLDKGMFLWMAVGFSLLAISLWFVSSSLSPETQSRQAWLTVLIILGVTFAAVGAAGFPDPAVNSWRFILLGVMTAANIIFIVLLIQIARRLPHQTAVWLFVTNIVFVFLLSGLARIPEQSIPLQWIEQIINTLAQGAFAYAAWAVARAHPAAVSGQLAYD